jgi:alpha-tubulin suppressor-like RCC1 family protein
MSRRDKHSALAFILAPFSRRRAVGFLAGSALLAFLLVVTCGLAGAAPSSASAGKISAHLSKTNFTSAQSRSVKLVYRFSAKSKRFSYLLTFKKSGKWQAVKSVKKKGSFKGSHTMAVKKLFGSKSVKIGSYRLKLSADKGSKLLSFKIGNAPTAASLPTISGTAKQGQTLTASHGTWNNSPTSFTYQWRHCDGSGASCSNISGASFGSYILRVVDFGSTIRVVATATNAYGSASATSAATTAVTTILAAVSAGGSHACALLAGGTVACWGGNVGGQLGNGTTTWDSPTPVQVIGITNAAAVSAGGGFTCAVLPDGTIRCWGYNNTGQLGDGVHNHGYHAYGQGYDVSPTPVAVSGISNATQVSAGDHHACALLSGGELECWGDNGYESYGYGQLGNGSTISSWMPVAVNGISNATQVSAGDRHTCALLAGGTVECWGDNRGGELGNGEIGDVRPGWPRYSSTPVAVSGITDATQVSAGYAHTCALLAGGTVECWGRDGTGKNTTSPIPVQVGGITNATQVSAGGTNSCALLSNGTVECWGWNGAGVNNPNPVAISGITNATQVSAGNAHNCALLAGGTVECWVPKYPPLS